MASAIIAGAMLEMFMWGADGSIEKGGRSIFYQCWGPLGVGADLEDRGDERPDPRTLARLTTGRDARALHYLLNQGRRSAGWSCQVVACQVGRVGHVLR